MGAEWKTEMERFLLIEDLNVLNDRSKAVGEAEWLQGRERMRRGV